MIENVRELLDAVRVYNKKIALGEELGQLVRGEEVEAHSFVQVMQTITSTDRPTPFWSYSQFWIDTLPVGDQGLFVGAYLNEWIGPSKNTKIVGIFNAMVPR
jgi:hypothetical protein